MSRLSNTAALCVTLALTGCAAGTSGPSWDGPATDSHPVDDADDANDADGSSSDTRSELGLTCGPAGCDDNLPCTADSCAGGQCVFDVKPGFCLVQGACHADGAKQPGVECGRCNAAGSTSSWTDDPSLCADDGLSCSSASCSGGACSHPLTSGFCLISGKCIADGSPDPSNACRGCDASTSTSSWSPQPAGTTCSGGVCDSGACCTGCLGSGGCLPGSTSSACGAAGKACIACTAGLTCSGGSCQSATTKTLDVGAHGSTFSSAALSRGFFFTAPQDFTIVGLRVPTALGTGPQNVEVLRLNVTPPTFSASTTNFTSLYYAKGVAGTSFITVNIPIKSGQIVGFLGTRGTTTMNNSYGGAPSYGTTLNGKAITLKRLLLQESLYQQKADAVSTSVNPYGRVEVRYLAN